MERVRVFRDTFLHHHCSQGSRPLRSHAMEVVSDLVIMNEEYENNQEDQYADDGVYGDITQEELQRLMDSRKQRYTEGYNKPIKTDKTVSVKVTIAILVGIFVYYMTFFALNIAGIISRLAMALCMLPMTIVIIVIYLIYRRRNQD